MNQVQMHNLDLNLLRVFNIMFEERSVGRVAARLNVTSSAVSHALSRLRATLQDDLFVRGPLGMQPTARALDIGPRVRESLFDLERALTPSTFDAAMSDRRFTISASPYACWTILPRLITRVRAEAPGCDIRVRPRAAATTEDLDANQVDLAIGRFDGLPARIVAEPLFLDQMVWVMAAGNPYAQEPLTMKVLAAMPHIVIMPTAADEPAGTEGRPSMFDHGALADALAAQDLQRDVRLHVPDAMSAVAVAAASDMVTLAPRRLIDRLRHIHELAVFDPPYPSDDIGFSMIHHVMHGNEPGLAWLKRLMHWAAA